MFRYTQNYICIELTEFPNQSIWNSDPP